MESITERLWKKREAVHTNAKALELFQTVKVKPNLVVYDVADRVS